MPLLHCQKCHHEWEGTIDSYCDWCGGENYVLKKETDFEHFVRCLLKEKKWYKKSGGVDADILR